MGMVNQLGKFSQNPTDLTQPLRQARIQHGFGVHSKTDLAFASVKAKLVKPCNHTSPLQPASTNKSVCWCIILQIRSCVDAEMPIWEEPVAYASRSMIDTEKRNAQIEKEALATTWACEKFATYILRIKFLIETVTNHLYPYWEQSILTVYLHEYFAISSHLGRFNYTVACAWKTPRHSGHSVKIPMSIRQEWYKTSGRSRGCDGILICQHREAGRV